MNSVNYFSTLVTLFTGQTYLEMKIMAQLRVLIYGDGQVFFAVIIQQRKYKKNECS